MLKYLRDLYENNTGFSDLSAILSFTKTIYVNNGKKMFLG
jgi:hypothetical protein